jgi:uncharacterized protein YbjT (DUF2867 family)
MAESLVTVFGGGGFIGRYVVRDLLKAGHRVRVAERNPKRAWFLKAQANLGQIQFAAADITDPASVARAVADADCVVNLVGRFDQVDAVQHIGARNVAVAAKVSGAKALVHISAIGANSDSPSAYGRSKGDGEAAVLAAFPGATILRPSIVFGREDSFVNRFAGLIRMLPVVPLIGGASKFQPVYVGDVAQAVTKILADPGAHAGKTYELGGPQVMSMEQVNRWIMAATGRNKPLLPVPDFVAGLMAKLTGWLPGAPMTNDQWLMLQSDNVVGEGVPGLADLGIAPQSLDATAPGWMVQYKQHGRFGVSE